MRLPPFIIALLLTAGVASAQPGVSDPGPEPTPGVLPPSPPATAGNCASWITGTPPQLGDAGAPCGASSVAGANPTASAGLTAVNGVAATFLRSDGAPAIDQTIAPTWTGAHTWTAGGTFNGGLASDGKSLLLVTGTNNGVAAAQYGIGESITCNTAAQLTNCDGYNGSVTWAGAAGYGNNLEGVNVPFMTLSPTFSESDTVASGTYNSGTGAVTLTMANSDNFVSGQTVYVNITGLTGPYIATGGTVGSTINFTAATGLSPVFTGGIVYTSPHVTYLDSCNGWNDDRTTPPAVSDFYNCTTANGAGFNYTGNPGIYNFNQFYGKDIGGRGSYLPVTGQTVNYNKFIALMSSATTNVAYSPVGFTNSSANITGTNLPPINTVVNFVNSGGALPSPFVAGTTYYVVSNTSNTTMTVSATLSGSPITATSAGTGTQNMISTGIATGTLNQCGFCVPAWNPPTTQGAGAVTQNGFYDQSTNVGSPDVFMPGVSIGTTNPPTNQGGLRVNALINANGGIVLAGNSSITSGNQFTVANGATLSVGGPLNFSTAAITQAAWGVQGLFTTGGTVTGTDSTTAANITTEAGQSLPTFNLAFTNAAQTVTNLTGLYIPAPNCSTNCTATNTFSLYTAGGDKNIGAFSTSGGAVTINQGSAQNVSILTGSSSGVLHISDGTGTGAVTIGNSANTVGVGAPATFSYTPGASTSGLKVTSVPYTAGSATTNQPATYLDAGASEPTTWSTAGTMLGINAPSGFTGNLIDTHVNGASSLFSIDQYGDVLGGALQACSTCTIRWQSRTSYISSPAAGQIQLGNTDAAAPLAQTLSAQSVVTGTSNTNGVNWTFAGSKGTGTGTGGSLIFQTAPASTTGSTPNAEQTILTFDQKSHAAWGSAAIPTISSCGTGSPTVTAGSTDVAGSFTVGTTATACTLTFKQAYTNTPFCTYVDYTLAANILSATVSNASLVFSLTSNSGNVIGYQCFANGS